MARTRPAAPSKVARIYLIEMICNQEWSLKNYFRESQRLDFPSRVGCLGGLLTNECF